jgi:hypothetical protein
VNARPGTSQLPSVLVPVTRTGDGGGPSGIPYAGVLANLFVHYAFGTWRAQQFPTGLLRGPAGRPMRAWKGSAQHE